jgi:hypothetical protein
MSWDGASKGNNQWFSTSQKMRKGCNFGTERPGHTFLEPKIHKIYHAIGLVIKNWKQLPKLSFDKIGSVRNNDPQTDIVPHSAEYLLKVYFIHTHSDFVKPVPLRVCMHMFLI